MADKIEFPFAQRDDVGEGEVLRRTELAAVTLVRYLALSSLLLNNSELPTLLRRTLKSLLFDSRNEQDLRELNKNQLIIHRTI